MMRPADNSIGISSVTALSVLRPLAVALPISALGVWALARVARRLGAVARVQPDRWHRSGEIPRLAGPALLAAVAPWLPPEQVAVAAVACLVGAFDDVRPLSPAVKALGILVAAVLAALVTGKVWVLPVFWLACNAVNLLDHADGLAAASTAGALAGLSGDLGMAGAGACLGFLLFNYPPARAFMGDSGSLTLGAVLVLAAAPSGPLPTLAWCAVPLLDAVHVTIKRLAAGRKPWVGGTDHSGHLLLRAGFPAWSLPPLYAAASLAIGLAAG
jgi:UDP-GlcNAc:undecaprenyl-phosphate GlcNAc-1-phosphate transferase